MTIKKKQRQTKDLLCLCSPFNGLKHMSFNVGEPHLDSSLGAHAACHVYDLALGGHHGVYSRRVAGDRLDVQGLDVAETLAQVWL